ncbi:thiol-disulfide oxidoreductase DCC family protein [Salinimicrobium flavum]|uniref:Thiol-disulfide oxidoreductase DCC family protein n=1 Tax=Salinimicrobium flavum TaxID=1737065 RepID=A0ABW5IZF5_9FLAO
MVNFPENKKIILFDGVCNLCNKTVQTIIKNDEKDVFRFAPLQSDIGLQIVNERGIDTENLDSVILIDPGVAYYHQSTAAIEIAKHLKGYRWLRFFKPLPEGFRDGVYRLIANNRYSWFGKQETCMTPTPELQSLFLK